MVGFSLPFIKGRNWQEIAEDQESIIHKSPVARGKLVISLADHIKKIQSINLCHGDIHPWNIIMNINEKGDTLDPEVSAKVIDFGQAVEMEMNKLVS